MTLATGGKTVKGVDLIAKGISLTVTGSNGSFYVTVDGKDAKLTVNDKNTELAIVTAQNGGKLSLSNGTFSRVAVKDDGSSASLSGGSYGAITSDAGYVNGSPTPIQSRKKSPLKKPPSRSKRFIRIAIRTTPETRRLRRTAISR